MLCFSGRLVATYVWRSSKAAPECSLVGTMQDGYGEKMRQCNTGSSLTRSLVVGVRMHFPLKMSKRTLQTG